MKNKRHLKIINLIKNEDISTQEELVARLEEDGLGVTQATISRDIKRLGLIKVPDGYGDYKYAIRSHNSHQDTYGWLQKMFQDFVVDMDFSDNIIVLKTVHGTAGGLGSAIDNASWEGVLGTVAGDNTIFLVVKPTGKTENIFNKFKKLLDD
ncbi:MAG: arginine repressor [Bacillota bacterium]